MIGAFTYKKIYRSGLENLCTPIPDYFSGYYAAIRQDVPAKKVYANIPYEGDTLLYDFDLNVNDTLEGTWIISQGSVVVAIDSVIISGNYHKRFQLNYGTLVEGVGNVTTGLLDFMGIGSGGAYWSFVCFSQDGIPEFGDTLNCTVITHNTDIQETKESMIYPNPVDRNDEIVIGQLISGTKVKIVFYNEAGIVVKTYGINVSYGSITDRVDNFPSGLYLCQIFSDDGQIRSGKFIVR